jgi:hypothetical protein
MKKLKAFISLLICNIVLSNCGSLTEAGSVLRNEKVKSSDQYLIKKRDPLTIPPDYDVVPVPGASKKKEKNNNSIKKILNASNSTSRENKTSASSTESSILKKIK